MRKVLAAACVGALVSACGSGGDLVAQDAADALHERVKAVRTAASKDRLPAALTAVDGLRAEIRTRVDAGELNPSDALVLLGQAGAIAERLAAQAAADEAKQAQKEQEVAAQRAQQAREVEERQARERAQAIADEFQRAGKGKGKGKKNRGSRGGDDDD